MVLFSDNSTWWAKMVENSYENQIRIPILIFLIFLMIFGIFGNSMVLYIYGLTLKKSNVQLFITALAFFDILGCFIAVPLDIVDLILPVSYTNITLCQIGRFSFVYFCNTSVLMLLLISIERHRDICHSTKTQLSRTHAKILIFPVGILALIMTIPMRLMPYVVTSYGPGGDYLYIADCMSRDIHIGILMILSLILLLVILIIIIVIFVLCRLVWRTTSHNFQQSDAGRQLAEGETNREAEPTTSYRRNNQTNRTLIAITVLYTATFVPVALLFMVDYFIIAGMAVGVETALMFFFRMWALNFAMKPLVYVFNDEQFRKKLSEILHLERVRCHNNSEAVPVAD